jgi:hypothetical protein
MRSCEVKVYLLIQEEPLEKKKWIYQIDYEKLWGQSIAFDLGGTSWKKEVKAPEFCLLLKYCLGFRILIINI